MGIKGWMERGQEGAQKVEIDGYFAHWCSFIKQMKLVPTTKRVYVAVSGGVDSVVLLFLTSRLRPDLLDEVRAVHFHHGLRGESDQEVKLVKELCTQLSVPLDLHYLNLDRGGANLEQVARQERYKILYQLASSGDLIYTGHQIDDSFEWSLMQQFKSSSLQPTLGIPLINGPVARPNLCLTKGQIYHIARKEKLSWSEDHTNQELRFDRNYIRNIVVPAIKRRFPTYLKQYVYRANQLAIKLGVDRHQVGGKFLMRKESKCRVTIYQNQLIGRMSGAQELVRQGIHHLSSSARGVLASQIEKMIAGADRGLKGPYNFSGGVVGFSSFGEIHLTSLELIPTKRQLIKLEDLNWKLMDLKEYQRYLDGIMRQKRTLFPLICFIQEMGEVPSFKLSSFNKFSPYYQVEVDGPTSGVAEKIRLVSALRLYSRWRQSTHCHRSLKVALLVQS